MNARRVAVACSLLLWPVLSCGGEVERPEPPVVGEAPAEVTEVADELVVRGHTETSLGDGIAQIEDEYFWPTLAGPEVVLSTPYVEEHWSIDEERWVPERKTQSSPVGDEEDPLLAERNARLAPLGVHLLADHGDEARLASGESFLLGQLGGHGLDFTLGVVRTDSRGRPVLDVLPRAHEPYATFYPSVFARAWNDVWVVASEVSGDGFDASSTYCPISIRHGQDGGYLAHFDGSRWRQLPWPAPGQPLGEVTLNADGTLDVVTGSPPEEHLFLGGLPAPQRTFRFAGEGAPTRVASPEEERAARLGWDVVAGATVTAEGRLVALPGDRVTRLVATSRGEAFVQTATTSDETTGIRLSWYHVR